MHKRVFPEDRAAGLPPAAKRIKTEIKRQIRPEDEHVLAHASLLRSLIRVHDVVCRVNREPLGTSLIERDRSAEQDQLRDCVHFRCPTENEHDHCCHWCRKEQQRVALVDIFANHSDSADLVLSFVSPSPNSLFRIFKWRCSLDDPIRRNLRYLSTLSFHACTACCAQVKNVFSAETLLEEEEPSQQVYTIKKATFKSNVSRWLDYNNRLPFTVSLLLNGLITRNDIEQVISLTYDSHLQ